MEQEILDLVNSNDEVIGQLVRSDTFKLYDGTVNGYIRFCECFVINSQAKVFVPVRGMHKKIAPGGLDFSAAGHVVSGTTYEEQMTQELSEELGIKVRVQDLQLAGTISPSPGQPYFSKVFVYKTDQQLTPNPDDFSGYELLSVAEFTTKLQSGVSAKDTLLKGLNLARPYLI